MGFIPSSGSQRRRLIPALSLDTPSPVRKPASSTGVRWVDGPLRSTQRGLGEPFEIKVYEIDDVERLQRRRGGNSKVRDLSPHDGSHCSPPTTQPQAGAGAVTREAPSDPWRLPSGLLAWEGGGGSAPDKGYLHRTSESSAYLRPGCLGGSEAGHCWSSGLVWLQFGTPATSSIQEIMPVMILPCSCLS